MLFFTHSRRLFAVLAIALLGMGLTYGAGTVTGRVTDKEGAPLAFANVVITHKIVNGQEVALKSQMGTVTDINGDYVLTGVPAGSFRLEAIYLGYQNSSVIVDLSGNETVHADVVMENKTLDLEEVVITSQAKGQIAAINQQLASIAIKNVVAADRINRNPDANAAEAIGRLPGVSVTRSGGEANDIVIRGMPAQYNTVLLNGIEVPSNKGESRNASLGGISQFSLQGIEVFKAITPDMDANTVSGAVNMQMRTAPEGFHGNLMVQGGYNHQNSDLGNHKVHANLSNRFFENRLGVDFNASYERINRSTQSMDAEYGFLENDNTPEFDPLFLNWVSLNSVERINRRTSGSLVVDWRFSPRSKIEFSSYYSSSPLNHLVISKNHNPLAGAVAYNLGQNRGGYSKLLTNALRGEHVLGIFHIDYSLSYSQSNMFNEGKGFQAVSPYGYDPGSGLASIRSLPLPEIIDMANDEETLEDLREYGMPGPGSRSVDNLHEEQYDARLNIKVPVRLGDLASGNIKFGGMYRHKNRERDYNVYHYGGPPFYKLISGIQTTPDNIDWVLPWVEINDQNWVSMENMVGGRMDGFLNGRYNFGWYPDVVKMNEVFDWWLDLTSYYKAQGRDYKSDMEPGWEYVIGQERMMGFLDPRPSVMYDNNVSEDYYASYLMGELNFGKKVSLIPGMRFEKTDYDLYAWWVERRVNDALEIPGHDTTTTRGNNHLLPMVHLKVKPLDWFHIQLSYTETLFRPDYNWIVPFEYVDDALTPYQYEAGVPDLHCEEWSNFDLMLAFHSNKIGLLSFNGFYKTVSNKIWRRSWQRIVSDDPVPYFAPDQEVMVTSYYNHEHETYVRGFEVEWQTSFWYLPKPFSYFTLTTNYSYINNQSVYPDSRVFIEFDPNTGRPIGKVRSDSTFTGPMPNQPTHLLNVSLGFNYKNFDLWLSYQYFGEILVATSGIPEIDRFKTPFYRLGLQARYELPIKALDGVEILFNIANLNNNVETEYLRGDPRPVRMEAYGMTADFGFRYIF
ncbi:MAG: TonB-dependent receptor [Bacteroidota bacterium]